MSGLELLDDALNGPGWFVASARVLGLPSERDVIAALEPSLAPDPRGAGKLHARDVIAYERSDSLISGLVAVESDSIAHVDGTDDYSRIQVDDAFPGAVLQVLRLVPPSMARPGGYLSADYFRYAPGVEVGPHQDGFGDLVVIWVLDRSGDGGESFLTTLDGRDVLRRVLQPGDVLAFRDELFLHGVTAMTSGHRDALIFITLKDGA